MSDVYIIVPCFNEEEGILPTLCALREAMPESEIVAINDGSTDRTREKLDELRDPKLTVVDLPYNMGIGAAVQTGLIYAARAGAEYAVKFDGDGQHPAGEIGRLLDPIKRGEADFTTGSRFLEANDGFQSTQTRRLGIYFFRFLSWILTGTSLTDSTSGFRAYNRRALVFASRHYPAFDYPEPQESILFMRNRFRVLEVPCKMRSRQGGQSSIRPFKALYYMVKVSFAMIIERFRKCKEG